ncbi:MAG: DUF3015 family protein [Bdellovibrionales bacterium]|nr:DUF3015 family protein [Oligoflexia bacterium]
MKTLVIALFALVSTSALAANNGIQGRANTGGYGMAGCGLGSIVFKENDKMQVLAATTNGTFGTQTFGITFGTSNCEGGAHMVSKEQVEHYIAANQTSLKNDMARGNGEALNGLAELMGQDSLAFARQMKTNYSKIFAKNSSTSKEITANLYSVLN